ncbi:MAG: ammonium transporter [Magnetococcales bacterium]|nr:ammonium transporter [Magnetococcales bacterium]
MILGTPFLVWADTGAVMNSANTAWILTTTTLVLFMTLPGLALFYGGLVRSKNVLSLLMQCMAITCLVSVLWLMGVYSLAFGDGGVLQGFWGGLDKAFMAGIGVNTLKGDLPETVFSLFQMTFAIITPALVVGGFAERVKFSAVVWFTILWMVFVYGPLCHWVWGGGWLQTLGVMDFAGGTVVHINAGVASLVAALMLGARKGFPHTLIMPHNMTMTFTGAAMLWVGWYGFNGGSALAANGSAGMAILVTHMAAAAGAMAWIGMEWYRHGKPSVLGIVTGMVAGLGTITPASGFVGPMGAVVIGLLAGVVCYFATMTLKQKLKIDDSLDVFPVHGVGGIMGTLLTGVFAAPALGGLGYSGGAGGGMGKQLFVQGVAVVVSILWSGLLTYAIFKVLDKVLGVRVTRDQESEGLDLVLHDEKGYNMMEYGPQ